ncbi:MAG: GIY-YIG nuclease family protein [Polynucleobacter sp.]
MSVVYFMQAGPNGPVKIGHSRSLVTRLDAIRRHNAAEVVLLGAYSGGLREEQDAHRQLAAYRIRGEWFHPTPAVLDFMAARCVQRADMAIEQVGEAA